MRRRQIRQAAFLIHRRGTHVAIPLDVKLKDDRNVNLVWFDSKLQNLVLPALPRPNYVNEADEKYYEPIPVGKMAEKYFEWVGEVSVGERYRVWGAFGGFCAQWVFRGR